ncbi:hypothetical protein M1615_03740 [Patescibacteria group bacterium]|nr:hypothetical protein [Patescibacteria group bacterium]
MRKFAKFLAFIFLVSLILPPPAKAYLDPGSASYLFQILIAGGLGVLFYIKTIIKWFKNLISGKSENETTVSQNEKV